MHTSAPPRSRPWHHCRSYFKRQFKSQLLCDLFLDLSRWNHLLTLLGSYSNFFTHLLDALNEWEQSSVQIATEQMARFSLIQGFSVPFQLGRCILQKMFTFSTPSHELMKQKKGGGGGGKKRWERTTALICNASAGIVSLALCKCCGQARLWIGLIPFSLNKFQDSRDIIWTVCHFMPRAQPRTWHEGGAS